MIAQVVNGLAILIGGFVGNALRGGISERFRSILMQAMALAVMLIGLRGAVQTSDVLIVVISLAVGALLGEIINIEKRLENLGDKLRNRVKGAGGGFTEGFVSASLIFCVRAMAIVGSLDAGLRGDYGTILTKSLIDGITAAMLASTLGVGVLFSAAAVFLYQSAITLLAGVLQPLLVRAEGDGFYQIIAGERRWRASKMAGLTEVPAIITDADDKKAFELAIIENIQRENLNPIEEAMAFKKLLEEFNLKQDEVAERVSKSRTAVTNSMRLLKLSEKVQQMIVDEMITTGHARALLALDDEEQQYILANKIFHEKLSVRETEKLVKALKNPKKEDTTKEVEDKNSFIYADIEDKMKSVIGTKVNIHQKKSGKGKIEIEYYSQDELERIFELIMSAKEQNS